MNNLQIEHPLAICRLAQLVVMAEHSHDLKGEQASRVGKRMISYVPF
jgi:hypothetical protein